MSFLDWYDFVEWVWEDDTPREKADRAHKLWIDCQYSISRGGVTNSIKDIIRRLFDSDCPEAAAWMIQIATAVGNINVFDNKFERS